uniref:Neurexin/syndecan/glycophorin C domain-containing protein n=1 Tax=Amazona collaria TaxID=241587 RepID=A0A8B9GGU5_9PSIT
MSQLQLCPCSPESKPYPGLHQKECDQQVKGGAPAPLLCSCETSLGVLCAVLVAEEGVIAAVVFVLICLLVVMVRYMYRHKGTYHTNEAKGTEFAESADAALKNDPTLQEAVDESKKEYFI